MNLPAAFEEKMRALLGDEFDEYIACYASVLFCRPLLSSGAECHDTGEPSSGRAGR